MRYVSSKYKLPNAVRLTLKSVSPVPESCYWELALQGESPLRTWRLTLYASPDFRFLSTDLFDTRVDPDEAERASSASLMGELTRGASAVRGSDQPAVNIVVFSDFQCPHCRNLAAVLSEFFAKEPRDVRVVFRHLPLPMHQWARLASEAVACAQLQNPEAFLAMHERVFWEQASISAENAKDKLKEIASAIDHLNIGAYEECMEKGLSVGLVLRDVQLAEKHGIQGTPTIFVNGRRLQGLASIEALNEVVADARNRAAEGSSASTTAAKKAKAPGSAN